MREYLTFDSQRSMNPSAYATTPICVRAEPTATVPPLFFTPCLYGHTYVFRLAQFIDPHIPIYVLPYHSSGSAFKRTVEGISEYMVQALRSVQPTGPYRISGYSSGGILAYEIASQLVGDDQVVSFLGLLDTRYWGVNDPCVAPPYDGGDDRYHLLELIANHPNCTNRHLDVLCTMPESTLSDIFRQLTRSGQEQSSSSILSDLIASQSFASMYDHARHLKTALRQYCAQPLPSQMKCLLMESGTCSSSNLNHWTEALAGNDIHVMRMSCSHDSMIMPPYIRTLGKTISDVISRPVQVAQPVFTRQYSPLTYLQRLGSSDTPLICIPGAGASVTSFLDLVYALGNRSHIVGLEPRGMDGQNVPHSTVSAAATFYLQTIGSIANGSPIHLIGHSFGGWIAFEIARQLQSRGHAVESLTLLDSNALSKRRENTTEYNRSDVILKWIELLELALNRRLDIESDRLSSLGAEEQLEFIHALSVREQVLPPTSQPHILRGPLRTFARALRTSYSPEGPYCGRVHIVLADHPHLDRDANLRHHVLTAQAWKDLAPDSRCIHGPGNHLTLLRSPNVHTLIRILRTSGWPV